MTAAAGKKNNRYAQTSVSIHAPPHLPFDLLEEEILWRLPVKKLRQLCCVSKSWNSLISSDSKFAKKHRRFSIFGHDRPDRHHLSIRSIPSFRIWKSPISSFFSSSEAEEEEATPTSSTDSFMQLNHPLMITYDYPAEVSTCHGLFCFGINESLALLCKLPLLDNSGLRYSHTVFTIVYDRFIDNYKTIAVSSCPSLKKEVHIHTFGTDYWRKIQDFPYRSLRVKPHGIFVSHTVNWLVHEPYRGVSNSGVSNVIVSLDLENESYQEILQPLYDKSVYLPYYDLGVLRDCLCVSSNGRNFSDIWIMKEYGNQKSWTKLLRVPYIGDLYLHRHTRPLYIHQDHRVLMRFFKTVYDSKNNTFKTHQIQNHFRELPQVYVESLISP